MYVDKFIFVITLKSNFQTVGWKKEDVVNIFNFNTIS